ncbi:hypothetical protein G6514_008002 [Epicoccum nigrum]|nr:hypothetical protein G6514_008002 [Epicoccum nigrum]
MALQSPKGLMLHGEVGTGKSMLIDLFQECLPNRKKKRWHFDTFMLHTISRLEQLRKSRALTNTADSQDEYSLLLVARDLIETSPILFLDEFQFPDRVASKILSNLMTSFFQLGGVLIATSNRMPDELAKAAGVEFARPAPGGAFSRLGWANRMAGLQPKNAGAGQKGEFFQFLELLKARCEIWEMEGKKDYRKLEIEEGGGVQTSTVASDTVSIASAGLPSAAANKLAPEEAASTAEVTLPKNYLIQPTTVDEMTSFAETFNALIERATSQTYPIPWKPATLTVYGRRVDIPAQHNGVAFFTFDELCGAVLGPADYVSLASSYHTFILTDIPVLTFLRKHEARRMITLLDALYEARCRLLITASAGPEDIFFPAPKGTDVTEELAGDAVYPETYSEIHQDLTSPFRPNVSSYGTNTRAMPDDALEDDPPNRARRQAGLSESDYGDEEARTRASMAAEDSKKPNFANLRGLTGEDEVFAVKRAQSRVWEMCSARWWSRSAASLSNAGEGDVASQGWWRPLSKESRHWERPSVVTPESASPCRPLREKTVPPNTAILPERSEILVADSQLPVEREKPMRPAKEFETRPGVPKDNDVFSDEEIEKMFRHGASPFRTTADPPPKFSEAHAWGVTTWGKKAGAWGKGVEGLRERRKDVKVDGEGQGGKKVGKEVEEKFEQKIRDDEREEGGKSAEEAQASAKTSSGDEVPWTRS